MTGVEDKHNLRESLKKSIPKRHHDLTFGDATTTTSFNQMWNAIIMHFGEMELIARREYERGYNDGKAGKKEKSYLP